MRASHHYSIVMSGYKWQSKPFLVVALDDGVTEEAIASVREWLKGNGVRVLNIAGPRESKRPGIYELTKTLLEKL